MTSQMSLSTCAKFPARIKKIASANKTTVSFREANGSSSCVVAFQADDFHSSVRSNPPDVIAPDAMMISLPRTMPASHNDRRQGGVAVQLDQSVFLLVFHGHSQIRAIAV